MKNLIKKIKASKTNNEITALNIIGRIQALDFNERAWVEKRLTTKYGVEALNMLKSEVVESYNQLYTKQGLIALIDETIQAIQGMEGE